MILSQDEKARYRRQMVLPAIGHDGQERLKAARVLAVGAGGIGSPLLLYLAAAGVGRLGIIDDDRVALSNLQRQILHDTGAIGMAKVDSATATLARINPHVVVIGHPTRLHAENAMDILAGYDLVVDGSDNFATRYLVNDACFFARRPLVSAALGPFEGQLTTIRAFEKKADGEPQPTYRCLFPEPSVGTDGGNCAEAGVLAPVAGVMGALAATEVIKELLDLGQGLTGQLLLFDAHAARFSKLRYRWSPDNPLTGRHPRYRDLAHHVSPV